MQEPQPNPKPKATFRDFKTFNDKQLVRMMEQAKAFSGLAARKYSNPYWLSFCGTSGTGKTFLSDIIFNKLQSRMGLINHPTLTCGTMRRHWPTILKRIYDRESWHIEEMSDANLLMLDEVSCSTDAKGFEREWLWRILSGRPKKWTLITSNHSLEQIASLIDVRIASRMVRDGSVVVEINTTDFSNR
jgi:DNA replication protein DnaC